MRVVLHLFAAQTKVSHLKPDIGLGKSGRGKRIRTSGPCVPNAVLYQAELFPDVLKCCRAMSDSGCGLAITFSSKDRQVYQRFTKM